MALSNCNSCGGPVHHRRNVCLRCGVNGDVIAAPIGPEQELEYFDPAEFESYNEEYRLVEEEQIYKPANNGGDARDTRILLKEEIDVLREKLAQEKQKNEEHARRREAPEYVERSQSNHEGDIYLHASHIANLNSGKTPASKGKGNSQNLESSDNADYSMHLFAIPIIGTLLIWFWVGSMNLLAAPAGKMFIIAIATVFGTAYFAYREASSYPKSENNPRTPTGWFWYIGLLWPLGYPSYLGYRKSFNLPNHLLTGVAIACLFCVSWFTLYSAIENQKSDIRRSLSDIQRSLDAF